MAKHEVTGQAQPAQGIPINQLPQLKPMPLAPGSRYATPKPNQRKAPSVAVKNVPADQAGLPAAPAVPSSSVYQNPPDKVVASPGPHPE